MSWNAHVDESLGKIITFIVKDIRSNFFCESSLRKQIYTPRHAWEHAKQ